jgi:REP element-mobilizing transposase RayT
MCQIDCMPRRLRIQYPGAIYHIMSRGNARQDIVRDDLDRERLLSVLGRTVERFGWRLFAFVLMTNHLHLVLKTPQPNLSKGMQWFLSSYANAWARRHKFVGHVLQGRYRTELVEDETYLWVLSRYVHLNPVRAGLVTEPEAWSWSSYPGYAGKSRRWPWVAEEELLSAWSGAFGGADPAESYRTFVTAGVVDPPSPPWSGARHGWVVGSPGFVERLRREVAKCPPRETRRETREVLEIDLERISKVVGESYGVDAAEFARRGSRHPARAALAYLARRYTMSTNASLVPVLGLSRAESVPNLTRRFHTWLEADPCARHQLSQMLGALGVSTIAETT